METGIRLIIGYVVTFILTLVFILVIASQAPLGTTLLGLNDFLYFLKLEKSGDSETLSFGILLFIFPIFGSLINVLWPKILKEVW